MTAVEKIIEEIEQELQDREGCNGALNSGAVLGLTNAKNIAHKYLEIEKEQMEITWNNAIDAQLKDKWDSYDDFHKTTFKSE